MPQHPTKQATSPANSPKHKITPKASQTADLNCLNFKLAGNTPKANKNPTKINLRPIKLVITILKKESGATAPAKSHKSMNFNITEAWHAN